MTNEEIQLRRPVWECLSRLFLDTELDERELQILSDQLGATSFTTEEIEQILRREVAPILAPNLLSPAGVWDGFDQAWLEGSIVTRLSSWRRLIPSLFGYRTVQPEWNRVRSLLQSRAANTSP